MKPIYTEMQDPITGEISIKADFSNGHSLSIPADESNSDYQRYLRHLTGEDESGTLS